MNTNKVLAGLLFAIVLLLAANLFYNRRVEPTVFLGAQNAQAQQIPTRYLVLDSSSFIITANAEGDTLYVYYFNRKPLKEESTIDFITKTTAKR